MKRILKVIKNSTLFNIRPELGYLVVTESGMSIFNGEFGIFYTREVVGELLCKMAEGRPYAILDPAEFLKVIASLGEVSGVDLNLENGWMKLNFGDDGEVKIPVEFNLPEELAVTKIGWKSQEEVEEKGIVVGEDFKAMAGLLSREGEIIWGDVVGIYGSPDGLVSFDYGVYMNTFEEEKFYSDFYFPLKVLDMGLGKVKYMIFEEKYLFLIGDKFQYVCARMEQTELVKDMLSVKESFEKGEEKDVKLHLSSSFWKRVEVFAYNLLTITIKNQRMYVSNMDNWKECIGHVVADNCDFLTRVSLLKRWIEGTDDRKLSLGADGEWNLYGRAAGGVDFYARLTDAGTSLFGADEDVEIKEDGFMDVDDEKAGKLI